MRTNNGMLPPADPKKTKSIIKRLILSVEEQEKRLKSKTLCPYNKKCPICGTNCKTVFTRSAPVAKDV